METPRRVARSIAGVAVVAALAAVVGCPDDAPRCGDGARDPGEDGVSCCADVGCAVGECLGDGAAASCRLPWEGACVGAAGACLAEGPLRCASGAQPPSYDCAGCGCGNADACVDGICYDAATRGSARDLDQLPDDLDVTDYVALPLALRSGDAASMATIAAVHHDEPRLDPRRNTFIVGWDPRSPGLEAVAGAWLAALDVETAPRNDADCAPGVALWPDGASVSVVPPDRAARVTCAYPGMFVDCVLPTSADCALAQGFQSETAIFLDLDVVLDDADTAMLIRAGRAAPPLRDAALVQALSAWSNAATSVGVQPGLAVADRYAAAFPSADAHVTWVLLAARSPAALRLESYRAVWANPPSQQFLVDHDMQTRDCAFAFEQVEPGALPDTVTMVCENAGATLTAVIETNGFTIVDVTTTNG